MSRNELDHIPAMEHLADFMFAERGRQLGTARIQRGLRYAVIDTGLTGPTASRYVLSLISFATRGRPSSTTQACQCSLMTLLGHRSPEMTIRYARLASPTLKVLNDQAAGKIARRIPVASVGRPAAPDRVEWLAAEMLKTRVAHGYSPNLRLRAVFETRKSRRRVHPDHAAQRGATATKSASKPDPRGASRTRSSNSPEPYERTWTATWVPLSTIQLNATEPSVSL